MRTIRPLLQVLVASLVSLAPLQAQQPDTTGQRGARADSVGEAYLPSGFSYRQLRSVLDALRPVPRPAGTPAESAGEGPRMEIDGLVVDETATKVGRDFYEVFYGAWEIPPGIAGYTIRIQEQPSPGLGTRVLLLLDDEPLLQLQLQPRFDEVEELAQRAAAYVAEELQRRRPRSMPAAAGDPGGA